MKINREGASAAAMTSRVSAGSNPEISSSYAHWERFVGVKHVVFGSILNVLLLALPLVIVAVYFNLGHSWIFLFSLIGIVPLAERLGFVTEQLSFITGPTVGGLLNATFGNATELIICIFAMRSNMVRLVQLSLLGSILSNMLLVLGSAFLAGGLANSKKEQNFNKGSAQLDSSLLLMAVMCVLLPATLHATRTEVDTNESELTLSRITSCIMLLAYAAYIYFHLSNPSNLREEDVEANNLASPQASEGCLLNKWSAIFWLAVLTVLISIVSEYVVDAIQGASEAWHIPVTFISVIILPIIGNASEHTGAIVFAIKDNLDLCLAVAIGSSTQISMLVIPFCVILGWLMGVPMDLNFEMFETAVLSISVLVVAYMVMGPASSHTSTLQFIRGTPYKNRGQTEDRIKTRRNCGGNSDATIDHGNKHMAT